jgi:transcriptional regulator with GAF, ATPase, and Fis domain
LRNKSKSGPKICRARRFRSFAVFQTAVPELFGDISDEELWLTVRDDAKYEALKRLGLRSAVVVPIPGRHSVLGVIGFASPSPNRYTSTELLFAQDLARRISLALENARLYRQAQEANRAKDEFSRHAVTRTADSAERHPGMDADSAIETTRRSHCRARLRSDRTQREGSGRTDRRHAGCFPNHHRPSSS